MGQQDYDTTIARMAGNIAAGLVTSPHYRYYDTDRLCCVVKIVEDSVGVARAIVVEVRRTALPGAVNGMSTAPKS